MNELDQFVKYEMKAKYYLRYVDDFVIADRDKGCLLEMMPKIADFLDEKLKLELHPNKVFLKTIASGVDFLGWVNFANHRVLRTTTKNRMFRKLGENSKKPEVVQSYLGLLSHGNSWKLRQEVNSKVGNKRLG